MSGPLSGITNLIITGVSHRTGSVGLRDSLFIEDEGVGEVTDAIRAAGADGVMVLSTCDRVEIHVSGHDAEKGVRAASDVLRSRADDDGRLASALYELSGEDALRHLFRVAASLESQVIGEPQVLGQLKAAHRMARLAGAMPPGHDALLQAAYAAAKQVRTDTRIAERPVSIATAAVAVARDVHGDLSGAKALMIGDADMGVIVAQYLLGRGLGSLNVTHPRADRAESLAERLDCHAAAFDDLASALASADVLVCALGRRGYSLNADMARAALTRRKYRPMLVLDLAVPGDVDPEVDRLDDLFMFDLANLDALASDGAHSREAQIPAAAAVVETALARFVNDGNERDAVPSLTRLRRWVDVLRDEALAESGGDAEKATRLLAARLLHAPSVNLRRLAVAGDGDTLRGAEALLDRLFETPGSGPDADVAGHMEDD